MPNESKSIHASHLDEQTSRRTNVQLQADPDVWKLSILTSALPAAELKGFQVDLVEFSAARGLRVHFLPALTCFEAIGEPITSEERGAVMGWLCSRQEVHFVHVHRNTPSQRTAAIGLQRMQSADAVNPPQLLLWNEEDLSQDPDAALAFKEVRHGN